MRYLFGLIIIVYSIFSCKSYQKTKNSDEMVSTNTTQDTIRIANDELEYEIIIIDVGFESWLVTQKPMTYYTNQYLRNWNNLYVSEWNIRVNSPHQYNTDLYEQLINYESYIDYGIEVNYKLFQYFQFFQKRYNQNLYGYRTR